jgi:hypothetical protein
MTDLTLSILLTVVLFSAFIILLLLGILKKRMVMVYLAILTLMTTFACGSWAVYLIVSRSYDEVRHVLKPRDGRELYAALFGEPVNDCVRVINFKDKIIPVMDKGVSLHCRTCGQEVRRIITNGVYELSKNKNDIGEKHKADRAQKWFRPEMLGDSAFVLESKKGLIIYLNRDSTEMYCVENKGSVF